MIRYSSDVTIDRPPRDVFAALLDPESYSQWTPMTDMSFEDAASPHVGQRVRFRLASGPIKGLLDMEIVELEPDRRLVFRISHPSLDWLSVTTLVPDGEGTRVTYAGEMSLHGWRRALEPVLGAEMSSGEAKEILKFKAMLERDAAPPATPGLSGGHADR